MTRKRAETTPAADSPAARPHDDAAILHALHTLNEKVTTMALNFDALRQTIQQLHEQVQQVQQLVQQLRDDAAQGEQDQATIHDLQGQLDQLTSELHDLQGSSAGGGGTQGGGSPPTSPATASAAPQAAGQSSRPAPQPRTTGTARPSLPTAGPGGSRLGGT